MCRAALILSRYAREGQLRSVVRNVSAWWNAAVLWDRLEKESDYKKMKQIRLMKMLEDCKSPPPIENVGLTPAMVLLVICDVLSKLEGVRHLSWSNCFHTFPIKEKIFCRLEQHFPSLTSLSLSYVYLQGTINGTDLDIGSGATFDEPLDLRSATSLSSLSLSHVRLSSPPFSPPLLLCASLKTLLLIDVFSRIDGETSGLGLWETNGPDGLPMTQNLSPSHILVSLDLSHIQSLWFGEFVGFSQLDFSHVFPPTFGQNSTGNQLGSFCLFDAGLPVLTALSTCCAFPQLHTFRMNMRPRDVLNVAHAERAIHNLSSFIGRQKALENVSVGIADMYQLDPNDYREDDVHAFEQALAKAYFRDALAGLKALRRLSLGTFAFGSQYPAFHEDFARSLSALQTFIIRCVKATNSAGALVNHPAPPSAVTPRLQSFPPNLSA